MSAEIYPPSGNNASFPNSTVGGRKPLHRFVRGQPKSTGVRRTLVICLPNADQTKALKLKKITLFVVLLADRYSDLGLFFLHRLGGGHTKQPHVDHYPTRHNAGFTGWLAKQ